MNALVRDAQDVADVAQRVPLFAQSDRRLPPVLGRVALRLMSLLAPVRHFRELGLDIERQLHLYSDLDLGGRSVGDEGDGLPLMYGRLVEPTDGGQRAGHLIARTNQYLSRRWTVLV